MRRIVGAPLAVTLLAFALVGGCKDKRDDGPTAPPATEEEDDLSFAEDGTDTSAADTDVQLVASSLVSAAAGEVSLATDLTAYVQPQCVRREPATGADDAGEVRFTFSGCQGRDGLRDVNGVVVANATRAAGKLRLALSFTDLQVNGADLDGSATTEVRADGGVRTMTWKATLGGTTGGGKPFTHQSEHTVTWRLGESCFELEGTSEGTVRSRAIRTEIQDFRRCGRGCPEEGGRIVITNVSKQKSTSLAYDGTNRATFTGPNGGTRTVRLLCRP